MNMENNLSEYEKSILKRREEKAAFIRSLKMTEIEEGLKEEVPLKRKNKIKSKEDMKKLALPNKRKLQKRSCVKNINFSIDSLFGNCIQNGYIKQERQSTDFKKKMHQDTLKETRYKKLLKKRNKYFIKTKRKRISQQADQEFSDSISTDGKYLKFEKGTDQPAPNDGILNSAGQIKLDNSLSNPNEKEKDSNTVKNLNKSNFKLFSFINRNSLSYSSPAPSKFDKNAENDSQIMDVVEEEAATKNATIKTKEKNFCILM